MAYKYSVKANWGKNANGDSFIRHEDRKMFYIEGFPGDVWVTDDNVYAERWIARHGATVKTKSQAQAIVDSEIDDAQAAYDALSEEDKALQSRPTDITLP
jgi:hypothetical protein